MLYVALTAHLAFYICHCCLLLQALKICFYHLAPNNHDEVSGLKVKWRSYWDGKTKCCWSVRGAITLWFQAQHWAKIECVIMQC